MNNFNLAPVVLFVFARPEHTKKTISALLENPEAKNTDLIIYADAAKNEEQLKSVELVNNIITDITGFKSVVINRRTANYGLAKNIIEGVSAVCEQYGRAIILEDDIVTSPFFLSFMNSALTKYQNTKEVWHVSGWNYPLKDTTELPDCFLWRTMNCWGWATWKDRWEHFEKKPKDIKKNWDSETIYKFNLDGSYNFFSQIEENITGKLDTWAIFWYATIYTHNGLCLNPTKSYVVNIGNDGSGENCGHNDIYKSELAQKKPTIWPNIFIEDLNTLELIKRFYKANQPNYIRRILSKIKRVFL
ncbi:hypothetical protein [Providencia rettgeri]|uniref:hypothetical protein n=1 Tax=Providencia rettgeri TaxID=587 RepID=UPI0023AA5529|nr:hypothetical protein [Providencia rettgeri]